MAEWVQDKGWVTGRLSELTEEDSRQDDRLGQIEQRQREHSQRLHLRNLNTMEEVGKLRVEMREMETRLALQLASLSAWRKIWTPVITGVVVAIMSAVITWALR